MTEYLQKVNSPQDLKRLTVKELSVYAKEVREYITETVMKTGGHLSSNLGSIELTIALHYVYDSPTDKIIFDVGHQAYAHKIITGRKDGFASLRKDGGVSGFPNATESEHDHFTSGHSSTSLSLGVGMARARDLGNEDYAVISVIGDGAFTGGVAFEALNDIGAKKERMLIVLNDNNMSISKNVGAFSQHLAKLRLSQNYTAFKLNIKKAVSALPFFGDKIVRFLDKSKENFKSSIIENKLFESMGVKYYGPVDGHDIPLLVEMLRSLKRKKYPALLHVVTKKGKGVDFVANAPDKYHGVSGERKTNEISYSSVVREKIVELAEQSKKVVVVTAAMSTGTGLDLFAQTFPERYYDVGIAEQHAVSMCAGLSAVGVKPYFAVYSSFLQRAYDQILCDICIDKRPVTLLIDHAGFVDGDGVTHQGIYDLSYLSHLPNMTILQPKDGAELKNMLDFSLSFNAPLAIRYPKSYKKDYDEHKSFDLTWEEVKKGGDLYILAVGGRMIEIAEKIDGATIISARVIKPLDQRTLLKIKDGVIVTLEDGSLRGGFGESVSAFYQERGISVKLCSFGYPDKFIEEYSEEEILEKAGLTAKKIKEKVKNLF